MNEQYLLKMSHKEDKLKEPFVDQWWLVFGWKTVISPILCIPGYKDDDSDANSSATSMCKVEVTDRLSQSHGPLHLP